MPRRGKEEKTMHTIMHHEHTLKKRIVKKLKTHFVILHEDDVSKTTWVADTQS
jgi:hypothetical protein